MATSVRTLIGILLLGSAVALTVPAIAANPGDFGTIERPPLEEAAAPGLQRKSPPAPGEHLASALRALFESNGLVFPDPRSPAPSIEAAPSEPTFEPDADVPDAGVGVLSQSQSTRQDGNTRRTVTEHSDRLGQVTLRTTIHETFDSHGRRTSYSIQGDIGGNGSLEGAATETWKYDHRGNVLHYSIDIDNNGDGVRDGFYTETSEYDRHGHRLRHETEYDRDGNGTVDTRTILVTRYLGNRRQPDRIESEIDRDGDGIVDLHTVVTFTIDNRGNITKMESLSSDGSIDLATWTYDDHRNVVIATTFRRRFGDDIDHSTTRTFTYDVDNRLIKDVLIADGVHHERYTITFEYDSRSNIIRRVHTYDDGDGGLAPRTTTTNTYDDQSHLVRRDETQVDESHNDEWFYTSLTLMEYDALGRITRREFDIRRDYTPRGTHTLDTYRYERFAIHSVSESDGNGDSQIEERITSTTGFDRRGRMIRTLTETDAAADGVVDLRVLTVVDFEGHIRAPRNGADAEPFAEALNVRPALASPNPFQASTTLAFSLAERAQVELRIHDLRGRLVRVLANGVFQPGDLRFQWDGRDEANRPVPNGVYFAHMKSGGRETTQRLLRVR